MPTFHSLSRFISLTCAILMTMMPGHLLAFEQVRADENTPFIEFGHAKVNMAGRSYTLELASNDNQRARGLMYRTELCDSCGMLFDFGRSRHVGMWMKNTNIALDVAYINANGNIINIEQMQPHSLQSHYSDGPVKFAIEMNLGWFAKQGLQAGDKVRLISAMPKN